jgi:hypothetical protein
MIHMTDELLARTSRIPSVKGYLYSMFFLNEYPEESILRYGYMFAKDNINEFIITAEEMPELPDLSGYSSEQIGGTKVYFGYLPNFSFLSSNIDQDKDLAKITATYAKDNLLITISLIGKNLDLKKLVAQAISNKIDEHSDERNLRKESLKYLPGSIAGWEFVTTFIWFSEVFDLEGKSHYITHTQGNYRKGEDFINLELRIGCIHEISVRGLALKNLSDIKAVTIAGEKASKGMIADNLYLYHVNEADRYSIICHDNKPARSRDEPSMSSLFAITLENLKDNPIKFPDRKNIA